MCSKIGCCKAFQLLIDFIFFWLGVAAGAAAAMSAADYWHLQDSRMTLGSACLEAASAGLLTVMSVWGIGLW